MSITYEMMKELCKVGFCFENFEKAFQDPICCIGETFYYNGKEYFIGDYDCSAISENDIEVIKNGTWLPNTDELMMWLQSKEIDVTIKYSDDDTYFYGEAKTKDGAVINGSGPDLEMCIYKLVLKTARLTAGGQTPPES